MRQVRETRVHNKQSEQQRDSHAHGPATVPENEQRRPSPHERVHLRHDLVPHYPHRRQVGIVGNGLVAELQLTLDATPSPSGSCRRARERGDTTCGRERPRKTKCPC